MINWTYVIITTRLYIDYNIIILKISRVIFNPFSKY